MIAFDDFSRLVQQIYSAAVQPDYWAVALDEISSVCGATGCALLITDRNHNEITAKSVGADPAATTAYNDHYCRLDIVVSALQSMPVGRVVPHEDLTTREELASSEFYNDWSLPNGYGDGLGSVLTRDRDSMAWLFVAARSATHPFGSPERIVLVQALVSHLQQAIRTQARLAELDRRNGDLIAAFDSLSDGVAIVGGDGRVIHMNPAAAAMVVADDGLGVRSGHLIATVGRTDGALGHLVHRALGGWPADIAAGGCQAIARPSGRRPYVARVIPLAPEIATDVASQGVLIMIADPEREPEPEADTLRRLYGLTTTEAQVAQRVLGGTGLRPIAEEMSLSLPTIRSHLQHVFNKTGTHRQAELVRLLLGGLAATRRPERPARPGSEPKAR